MNSTCTICKGEGWVCEYHSNKAWGEGDGCCGGAGMPCVCHPWFKETTIVDCLKKMNLIDNNSFKVDKNAHIS
jgi:hypothetical protein